MFLSKTLLRGIAFLFLFSLTIGCSKGSNPIVLPSSGGGGELISTFPDSNFQPQNQERQAYGSIRDYYIERTGPDELLNTSLKLPWTLNKQLTFTGILHAKEKFLIKRMSATVNDKPAGKLNINGDQISFSPNSGLVEGYNHIYIGIVFESGRVVCAVWHCELLSKPPQISGFLGDGTRRQYDLCFSREVDKDRIEINENWALNGDSSLIENVRHTGFGNWVRVQLVDESKKQDFRDDDYLISFDTGQGLVTKHLIPKKEPPKDSGCGIIEHNPGTNIHRSIESEGHALTYAVVLEQGCELDADADLGVDTYTHEVAIRTALQQHCNNPLANGVMRHYDISYGFPLTPGWHTLQFDNEDHSVLDVEVFEPGDPPISVWKSPDDWNFEADFDSARFYSFPCNDAWSRGC